MEGGMLVRTLEDVANSKEPCCEYTTKLIEQCHTRALALLPGLKPIAISRILFASSKLKVCNNNFISQLGDFIACECKCGGAFEFYLRDCVPLDLLFLLKGFQLNDYYESNVYQIIVDKIAAQSHLLTLSDAVAFLKMHCNCIKRLKSQNLDVAPFLHKELVEGLTYKILSLPPNSSQKLHSDEIINLLEWLQVMNSVYTWDTILPLLPSAIDVWGHNPVIYSASELQSGIFNCCALLDMNDASGGAVKVSLLKLTSLLLRELERRCEIVAPEVACRLVHELSRHAITSGRRLHAQNRSNAAFLADSAPPICHKSRHRVHQGPYSQYPIGGYYYPNVQQPQVPQYRPGGVIYNPWAQYGYNYPPPVVTTPQPEEQTAKEIEAGRKLAYFSSFHPFAKRNTHWFLDDSSDDIWPGTNKIKVGKAYPAIINYFFTPNCAMIVFMHHKVEVCMTLEDLPKEIEAYSLKDIFRPYHLINVTLQQPLLFDEKLRPRVTISKELETIPKLERLQRVFCKPIFMNRFAVVFEIEGETLLGQVFFREMGFRKFDAHDYPMDMFFKKGETVELEVLNTPLYPTRCGYLLRVPFVSTLRDRWCDEMPEIADAVKYPGSEYEMPYMNKYNAYVDFSVGNAYAQQHQDRWNSSPPQGGRTYTEVYPRNNQAGAPQITYRYTPEPPLPSSQDEKLESLIRQRNQSQLQDILPSEAKPCTIAAFTKRIGGRLKDVLKYLFIKTKIPIDSSRRLTKNLAKRIYNFVTGREEFGDIDANEELLEIQHLQSTKDADDDRAPVVVLMGHVDHGKTSLFDLLCNSSYAKKEAGQITQGIRAAKVEQGGFTLIDTPGHEIFDVMRINGAKTADLAIIVIAGNEGIKDQTRESLQLCKDLQVPFIVAVTKCDLPNLCTEEVATDLAAMDILIEPLGGDVQFLNISSVQDASHCVRTVTEAVNLQYAVTPPEPVDLPENYLAQGFVLESGRDAKNGQYSMLLVKHGSVAVGQYLTCGSTSFKVAQIRDTSGEVMQVAKPSDVVCTFGYEGPALVPGSEFVVLASQEQADVLAEVNLSATKTESAAQAFQSRVDSSLETFGNYKAKDGVNSYSDGQIALEVVSVPLYIKSDSAGAIDALCKGLQDLEAVGMTKRATFTIHKGTSGQVTIADVMLAATHKGCLCCFNSAISTSAKNEAKRLSVDVISGNVIYHLLQDALVYLGKRLGEPLVGHAIGTVKILKVFEAAKRSTAAGGVVSSGKVVAGAPVRLVRNNLVIYAGKLASLRRTKEEAQEIGTSESCGMTFENFNDVQPNDIVHVFDPITLATTIKSN